MGYDSMYSLKIQGDQTLIEKLRKENESAYEVFDEDGISTGFSRWYDDVDELKEFSRNNPGSLFILSWEGEDGAEGVIYAKDGKSYEVAKPEWKHTFNEKKLK